MAQYRLISADSHMCEPPNLWVDRIDQKYRDRAPRTVKGYNGKEGEWFVCENISPIPIAGAFGAGVKAEDLTGHNKKGFEAAPASVWDPAARLKEQDADGVAAEVLYTTFGMMLYGLNDAELRAACFRAYNDFVASANHEADWEHQTISISEDMQVVSVYLAAHHGGARFDDLSQLQWNGTHVIAR